MSQYFIAGTGQDVPFQGSFAVRRYCEPKENATLVTLELCFSTLVQVPVRTSHSRASPSARRDNITNDIMYCSIEGKAVPAAPDARTVVSSLTSTDVTMPLWPLYVPNLSPLSAYLFAQLNQFRNNTNADATRIC